MNCSFSNVTVPLLRYYELNEFKYFYFIGGKLEKFDKQNLRPKFGKQD